MRRVFIMTALLSLVSCYNSLPYDLNDQSLDSISDDNIIPVDQALKTLDAFLSDYDLLHTKAGSLRKIHSIDTYYRKPIHTKSTENGESTEIPSPTAYIVNFENQQGFAVLGATNLVPDIVAVTENGSINPITLAVTSNATEHIEESASLFEGMDAYEIENFNKYVTITADSLFYSTEDEDYFAGLSGAAPDSFTSSLIEQALEGKEYYEGSFNSDYTPDPGSSTGTVEKYTTKSPMLVTNWAQGTPYNYYCKRGENNLEAKAGCSTVAMAMIVAYNEYPDLQVGAQTIEWPELKTVPEIESLSASYQTQLQLLIYSIYTDVQKITAQNYTLITPKQIANRMIDFGYTNVTRHTPSSINESILLKISKMLSNDKPVFISAIPKGIKNWQYAHSWVIDGAKYSLGGTYLMHMNFGWRGACNGYFATDCLNPSKGVEYDDPKNIDDEDYSYTWHFRVITYDKPSTYYSKFVPF